MNPGLVQCPAKALKQLAQLTNFSTHQRTCLHDDHEEIFTSATNLYRTWYGGNDCFQVPGSIEPFSRMSYILARNKDFCTPLHTFSLGMHTCTSFAYAHLLSYAELELACALNMNTRFWMWLNLFWGVMLCQIYIYIYTWLRQEAQEAMLCHAQGTVAGFITKLPVVLLTFFLVTGDHRKRPVDS